MSALQLIRKYATPSTIKRVANTQDGTGGAVATLENKYLDVYVWVQERSGSEAIRYGRESNRRFGIAFIDPAVSVIEADVIIQNGRSWDIQAIRTRGTMQPLQHTVAEVEETL